MKILGIDPGKSGGIACFDTRKKDIVLHAMPETRKDIADLLENLTNDCSGSIAFIEKLTYAQSGRISNPRAMGVLAENRGCLLGILETLGVVTVELTPQDWQKTVSAGTSKPHANHTAWKNHLKGLAQRFFPSERITLKTADAALIVVAGHMKQHNGAYPVVRSL